MSQIIHNVSFPNDGNGDELREAFVNQNTMNTELYSTKVDKVSGKDLSSNDYTNAEKAKLAGIEANAQVNVQADFTQNDNTQADYIKNKPEQLFASVGYFDHNDLATHTTPITLTSGVNAKLTNDALGVFTDFTQAPYGISNIWNTTTNQFDFSSLDVGDTLDLRVDCLLTTTVTNKTYKIFLKLGIGTPAEYVILVGTGELKSAVTNEPIVKEASFYIGSSNVQTAPAELYIVVDTIGSVKVNGWYTRILRKSVNIVGIEGDDLKQDKLTETNFGTFSNGLTTEDAIADADLINYTDVSDANKQKKTTWSNIKAKLALIFQYKLVAGTNITIDNTNPLAPVISASGGGGSGGLEVLFSDPATYSFTGAAANFVVHSFLIPANTLEVGDFIQMKAFVGRSGTYSDNIVPKIYVNTINSFSGATLVSSSVIIEETSTIFQRDYFVRDTKLASMITTFNQIKSHYNTNSTFTETTIDRTQDLYFMLVLYNSLSSTVSMCNGFFVSKSK